MNFLDSFISPPRADHILIAKYIIIAVSLFFIPYMSILLGSTLFSLGFSYRGKSENNPVFTRFAKDLAETFLGNTGAALIMGVLPVIAMAICFAQILYATPYNTGQYFTITLLLVALALIAARLYRNSFNKPDESPMLHYGLGIAAHGLTVLALLAFAGSVTFVLFPEEWPINKEPIPLLYDWNVIAQFMFVTGSAVALTCLAILFFFFSWMGGKQDVSGEYAVYVRKFSSITGLIFTILQTPLFLWAIGTLPFSAKSYMVYYLAFAALAVLFVVSYLLYLLIRDANAGLSALIFPLFLIFWLVFLVNENFARENALVYQNYALKKIDTELRAKMEAEREERGGVVAANVELGEQVYTAKCTACHQFEQRVVGPPYVEVLPKYAGDVQKLKAFILNPEKVNPEYIQMPNLGLKPNEAESAAMYLIKHYEELSKK